MKKPEKYVEVITVANSVTTEVDSVVQTSTLFENDGKVNFIEVPGHNKESFAAWGESNDTPFRIIELAEADEVVSEMCHFNTLTCYGGGIHFKPREEEKPMLHAEEIQNWSDRNLLEAYFLNQCSDMKYFFFTVCVIILSKDRKKINRLVHKDACYCRLEKADKNGIINHVYYGDFRDGTPEAVERLELLSMDDPLTDLRERIESGKATEGKFAMVMRFPTVGCQYYPHAPWTSIYLGGSYEERRLISKLKRAKLRNFASVKYQVEIEDSYWDNICEEDNIHDPLERQERIDEEKQRIRDFVSDTNNADKVWISGCRTDPATGKVVKDVTITKIDTEKAGGDWADDAASATNNISFAGGCHPSLIGATPGKAQMNNSGSDKRELFTMKQALEIPFHAILLQPLRLICAFNGWDDVRPEVPMIQLTTLDEHTDAKEVANE